MTVLVFRPIKKWPEGWLTSGRQREGSPFTGSYQSTLNLLGAELAMLATQEATLQVDASERDCRIDGQLRTAARVKHPGVILTLETKKLGTLIYSTDRFVAQSWKKGSPASWQHNLRAIALGLEALRKVERYGIAERGEQYAGYRELGSGIPLGAQPQPSMSAEEAARLMAQVGWPDAPDQAEVAHQILDDPDVADLAYRMAAKRAHPDVGGDPALFREIGEARRVVALAFRRG